MGEIQALHDAKRDVAKFSPSRLRDHVRVRREWIVRHVRRADERYDAPASHGVGFHEHVPDDADAMIADGVVADHEVVPHARFSDDDAQACCLLAERGTFVLGHLQETLRRRDRGEPVRIQRLA